ncbi:MAG: PrgI family protein [Candidatus Andersenbacteria bacterium]|nr:PrgI family protein [Candidatus Andersenbacteria bacterium]MBI3250748.1 PrgI family protein [Candidatus Andersenbacteria bacterium]
MRYQVPQFVDIEDKILGPLTLKQFLMYVAAALTLVPVFLFSDLALFFSAAFPVLGIAAAFAHWKVNGKSLASTVSSAFRFYSSGQLYIWQRTKTPRILVIQDAEWEELLIARGSAQEDFSALAATSRSLETEGNISKVDEEDPLTVPQ